MAPLTHYPMNDEETKPSVKWYRVPRCFTGFPVKDRYIPPSHIDEEHPACLACLALGARKPVWLE